MKSGQSQQVGGDADAHRGTAKAIAGALNSPLLIDQAADADFARLINRLRGEPGTEGGKQ